MSKPNYDALHRLDTLPLRGKGERLHVLVMDFFPNPMPDLKTVALAIRVLAVYKRDSRNRHSITCDPVHLIPTQYGIFRAKLEKDVRKHRANKPVICWKHRNKLYILDGHHRVAAALLTGKPDIEVIVV